MVTQNRDPRSSPLARCVVALALLAGACGTTGAAEPPEDDAPTIAATTTILGDVVSNVAPATAEISVLMTPGADPHTYEPSARQLAELQEADLIVANGGGLEAGLQPALDAAERAGTPVFSALEHVTPLTGDEVHADDDTEEPADDHDHGAADPHFWMDPVRMAEAVDALGARIGELTGTAQRSADRAARYSAELRDLDGRIRALLDDLPADRRTIVTNHEALAYFAERYDVHVVGTIIPGMSTGAEPSAQDIEQLAAVVRREGVTAIFAESTAPRRLADTLAGEVDGDVDVVVLFTESVGGDDGPETYADMLMTDAELISGALRR